jgi:hypothetical protein
MLATAHNVSTMVAAVASNLQHTMADDNGAVEWFLKFIGEIKGIS